MAGIAVLDGMQRELTSLPKVRGILIIQNETALPVRSTIPKNVASTLSAHILKLLPKAQNVLQEVDPHDALTFFRVRGKNFEYIVYCEKEYTMVAVQEHTAFEILAGDVGGNSGALKMVTEDAEGNVNARNANSRSKRKGAERNVGPNDGLIAAPAARRLPADHADGETGAFHNANRGASSMAMPASGAAGAAQQKEAPEGKATKEVKRFVNDDFLHVNFLPRQN